jgi:MFS family permease
MPDSPSHLDPYGPWRSRDFRRYAGSWFLMAFSRRVEFVAVSVCLVRLYSESGASFALGMMGLVQALPFVLLAIAGGQLADRFDRRRVMVLTFGLPVLSAAGLLVVAPSAVSVPWVYLMLGLGAVGWALGSPARQAMLPQLVSTEVFPKAVAWNSSVFYIASVTGPAIGGIVVAASHSVAPAFALVLACRVIGVAAIFLIRHQPPIHAEPSLSWENVVAGVRFVWNTKLILATITLDLFAVLLGGATYLLPVYADKILHVGAWGLGFLQSADAVGAICMVLLLTHLPPMRRAGVTLLWAVAGFGLATIIFGLSKWFWLSLLMMFLVGALDNISVVVRHTLVQMLTPDAMRGRVSAVNSVFIVASNDLGGSESGMTAWLFGPVIAVVAGGAGTILVVLAAARLWPQILGIGSLDSIRPAAEEEPSHV